MSVFVSFAMTALSSNQTHCSLTRATVKKVHILGCLPYLVHKGVAHLEHWMQELVFIIDLPSRLGEHYSVCVVDYKCSIICGNG